MGQPPRLRGVPWVPSVLAIPVLTLEVWTWLMRRSCSGFTSTTILMLHRHCRATCGARGGVSCPPHSGIRAGGGPAGARYHAVVDGHQRLEGGAQELDPLAVAQGVLLGADDVDVVGDAGGGLVLRAPQAPRGQPGGEGARRRGAAWGTGAAGDFPPAPRHPPGPAPCVSGTPPGSARITPAPWSIHEHLRPVLGCEALQASTPPSATAQTPKWPGWGLRASPSPSPHQGPARPLTHVPRPDVDRDEVGLVQVGVLDLHQLQQLAEGFSLLWVRWGAHGGAQVPGAGARCRGTKHPKRRLGQGDGTPRCQRRLTGVACTLGVPADCVAK